MCKDTVSRTEMMSRWLYDSGKTCEDDSIESSAVKLEAQPESARPAQSPPES